MGIRHYYKTMIYFYFYRVFYESPNPVIDPDNDIIEGKKIVKGHSGRFSILETFPAVRIQ